MSKYKYVFNGRHYMSFRRLDYRNFWYLYSNRYSLLMSYNTIVGIVDNDKEIVYEVHYSSTTTRQVTQFLSEFRISSYQRERIDSKTLAMFIKNITSYTINTEYNGA